MAFARARTPSIIDRHGYDCKYDAFIALPVSNRNVVPRKCVHNWDTHRRMENVSRANLIRNSFRPDRKSAINFLPVSWIKITKFKESYVG